MEVAEAAGLAHLENPDIGPWRHRSREDDLRHKDGVTWATRRRPERRRESPLQLLEAPQQLRGERHKGSRTSGGRDGAEREREDGKCGSCDTSERAGRTRTARRAIVKKNEKF